MLTQHGVLTPPMLFADHCSLWCNTRNVSMYVCVLNLSISTNVHTHVQCATVKGPGTPPPIACFGPQDQKPTFAAVLPSMALPNGQRVFCYHFQFTWLVAQEDSRNEPSIVRACTTMWCPGRRDIYRNRNIETKKK